MQKINRRADNRILKEFNFAKRSDLPKLRKTFLYSLIRVGLAVDDLTRAFIKAVTGK